MKKTVLILAFLSVFMQAFADDYVVSMLPDKNVIYVDKLGLSDNTTVIDVIQMMPELVCRGLDELLTKYDIQYDGKSVGASRDVILLQTMLNSLEKIEITNLPTVTQQKSGQAGVINLVPAAIGDGVGGEAIFAAATLPSVLPSAIVTYKNKKLELRANLDMEYYAPEKTSYSCSYRGNNTEEILDTTHTRALQETAKVNLRYNFSDRDVFKMWLIESVEGNKDDILSGRRYVWDMSQSHGKGYQYVETESEHNVDKKEDILASAKFKYEHTSKRDGKLSLYASYDYSRRTEGEHREQPHDLNAEVSYNAHLLRRDLHLLDVEAGVNSTFHIQSDADVTNRNSFYSPYVLFKYTYSPAVQLHAGVKYQHYDRYYRIADVGTPVDNANNDFSANLNLVWQIRDHHALRLILDRNVIRPVDKLLYPGLVKEKSGVWWEGNPDLLNTCVRTADLKYIFDWQRGGHSITFNAGLAYNVADNLVKTLVRMDPETGHFYNTPVNSGRNDILSCDFMLMYSYGVFSMSFAGNLFHDVRGTEDNPTYNSFYNLNLSTFFHFRERWTLSAQMLYNSPVYHADSMLGDCFFSSIRLNKGIGQWEIFAELSDIFDYIGIDRNWSALNNGYTLYDMYPRYVTAGVIFRFGNWK